MNWLIASAIVTSVGLLCLFVDLGVRLAGHCSYRPMDQLVRLAILLSACALLVTPLLISVLLPSDNAKVLQGISMGLSVLVLVHFAFPLGFRIRKVPHGKILSEKELVQGIVLRKLSLDRGCLSKMDGFSCLIVSDLHCNSEDKLQKITCALEKIRDRTYQMIFILGDLGERKALLPETLKALASLQSVHGTFLVRGNHDSNKERCETIERLCSEYAIHLLANRSHSLSEVDLTLVGLEKPWHPGDIPETPQTKPWIGLTHSPDNIHIFARMGASLVLAGHTHGGELLVPVLGPILVPSTYGRFLHRGWFRLDETLMFVTSGIGYFPGFGGIQGEIVELVID